MRVAADGTADGTASGVALHVAARGTGRPALVFLHYFAGSSRAWGAVVARLVGEYRCVAPDLRGFGDSPAPADGYAVAGGADDVANVVHALGLDSYVLVGHSMGGKVALAFAARRPPGLRALVLVAPSPPTPEPIPDEERARLLAGYGDRSAALETARRITARPLPAPLLDDVVADALRSSRPAWVAWLERGSREDISAWAPSVAVPTLVIAGDADSSLPASLLEREVARRIPGARMAVVADAGHLVPVEAPAATAGLIREHSHPR